MRYVLNKGINTRPIDQEYVVFANYSRETLVLHPIAFELLELLKQNSLDSEHILSFLSDAHREMSAAELQTFVQSTLQQFIAHGLIECID